MIIGGALSLGIFALSFLEKRKEGDAYYARHENWPLWWYSNNDECNNNMARSASNFAKPGLMGTVGPAHANQANASSHDHPAHTVGPSGHEGGQKATQGNAADIHSSNTHVGQHTSGVASNQIAIHGEGYRK